MYSKVCCICNKQFTSYRQHTKTCSSTCRSRLYSKKHRNKTKIRKCLHCGANIQAIGLTNNKRYCSNKCKNIVRYKREKSNPNNKLKKSIRSRLHEALHGNVKPGSFSNALGCSISELRIHIESKFYNHPDTDEPMTWNNRGNNGWHIDHIIPLSSFDLTDIDQFNKACHYTNLQPLWAKDNLKKSNKIVD